MLEYGAVLHARERAALRVRHCRVPHGVAAQVGFVNHSLRPGHRGALAKRRVERPADDRHRDPGGAVQRAHLELGRTPHVIEHGFVPCEFAADLAAVWVQQQLVRVAAQAVLRLPRAVDAVAVTLAGLAAGQVAVPDAARAFGQVVRALRPAVTREQAEFDRLGGRGVDGEVDAVVVRRRAERRGSPGFHGLTSVSRVPG